MNGFGRSNYLNNYIIWRDIESFMEVLPTTNPMEMQWKLGEMAERMSLWNACPYLLNQMRHEVWNNCSYLITSTRIFDGNLKSFEKNFWRRWKENRNFDYNSANVRNNSQIALKILQSYSYFVKRLFLLFKRCRLFATNVE